MTDILSLQRSTPRAIRKLTEACIEAHLVPFIQSSPGMGKSSIVGDIANEYNLHLIDHRMSTSAPEDLNGLPRFDDDGYAYFTPFADLFPLENTPLPEGKDGWLLFLDEANSASKSVQAAMYKIVLDRMVGQHKLHERVIMVLAGNLSTDKAITTQLSTAMQSRLVHLEMSISHAEWLEDVAFKHEYDHRVIAFLNFKKDALMDFDPNHKEKTFCCPRTWEFMNKLVKDKDVTDEKTALYAGTITSGVAVEFVQFCKVYSSLPSLKDVLADPENLKLPGDNASKWAVVSFLMSETDETNFDKIMKYIDRFDMTFRIIYIRALMIRIPKLRHNSAFLKAMSQLSRYLND